MARRVAGGGWKAEFDAWLAPFLACLPRGTHRRWAPTYLEALLGPTARKNIERVAAQIAPDDYDQLHHFLTTAAWDAAPLLHVLAARAQTLLGGPSAVLIIDDTSLLKQGTHSVGVARQYSGQAGKLANCQTLVSLTLARQEVPFPLALALFLPTEWTDDPARCRAVGVPLSQMSPRSKGAIALEEVDRVRAAGVTFGVVLADAGYGASAAFRQALSARGLTWAVGIPHHQKVYAATVGVRMPRATVGRPRRHPVATHARHPAATVLARAQWRRVTWRTGTKGPLHARFAAVRVVVADGPRASSGAHLPGTAAWLVGEWRATGERKYYLTNHPPRTPLRALVAAIKARWSCEQAHQQLKEELGLDHFEGRSWIGLHHHTVLTMIAFAFLQHYRLTHRASPGREKKLRASPGPHAAGHPAPLPHRAPRARRPSMPPLRRPPRPRAPA